MAIEKFIDSLRSASRRLAAVGVSSEKLNDFDSASSPQTVDSWLSPKSVEGFDAADFDDWSIDERRSLEQHVAAFRAIVEPVSATKPATKAQLKAARTHLTAIIKLAQNHILPEWLEAQEDMLQRATTAARSKGWYVEKDEKEIRESLLGKYMAPRLRIRTPNNEVVLDPIACFGSGRKGVVDLVVMPTYETAYFVTLKNGAWQIARQGSSNSRPFTPASLVNTINKLPRS